MRLHSHYEQVLFNPTDIKEEFVYELAIPEPSAA
jgi:hypothetical protein